MLRILVLFLSLGAAAARASTFVGNGGTPGDLEYIVARNSLIDTFEKIDGRSPEAMRAFGKCSREFDRFKNCDTLSVLGEEEREFLRALAGRNAGKLADMLRENRVVHRWTDDKIAVKETGGLRSVDAVIDRKSMTLTLNKNRFLEMTTSERMFLLAHELGHLLEVDGQPIDDDRPVGPFDGKEGGRELLNAFGAAASQSSFEDGSIYGYAGTLNRSQSWKPFWVGIKAQSARGAAGTSSAFANESYAGSGFNLRYQFTTAIGGVLDLQTARAQKTVLGSIQAQETKNSVGLGLSYRMFFTENPLSPWAQHHVVLEALWKRVRGEYSYEEGVFRDADEAVANTWGAGVKYYLPLQWDLWVNAAVGLEGPSYSYTKINVKNSNVAATSELGVTYAF